MGVRFPAGMCSALCTRVSCSLGWGGTTTELVGTAPPAEGILLEIFAVDGAGSKKHTGIRMRIGEITFSVNINVRIIYFLRLKKLYFRHKKLQKTIERIT